MEADYKDIADLLHRLNSRNPGPAWEEFLRLYSALIMKTVLRFEFQEERKNDCFLYVCEKLSDQDFRRLRSYRSRRNVEFASWLAAVVFNLCVDWHRREFGRAVLLPAVSALPAFDQLVYRCHFEQGMPASEALEVLRSEFPEADRAMLAQAMGRIHRLMTPRQRWQAGVRLRRRNRQGHAQSREPDELPSPVLDPHTAMRNRQREEVLESAMRKLSTNDRLVLRLRYQEGLTLRQIAGHFGLGDTSRAWRQIQSALRNLARLLPGEESAIMRKK